MEGRKGAGNLIHTSNISGEHPSLGTMLDAGYVRKKEHGALPSKPQGVLLLDR